jgi:FkbM family methyltransferase
MGRIFYIAKRAYSILGSFPRLREKLNGICVEYHQTHENLNYEMASNGEGWLVETLAQQGLLNTVFDVGANQGEWTGRVLEINPKAMVHCFEICPPTFQKLSKNLAAKKDRATLNPFGLSDAPGEIKIKYSPNDDGKTSMFNVLLPLNVEIVDAKVIAGKDYCASNGIQSFDFLKIDVEGAEHLVLKGFGDILTPEKVPVIQFEYGLINIETKFLLKDSYAFFESRGYKVGKLLPNGVRFRAYRYEDEDFFGPNYVAASPQRATLLQQK